MSDSPRSGGRRKLAIALVVLVVLGGVAYFVGPWIYAKFIAEDDAPAAAIQTSGAAPASGPVDGAWAVVPGEGLNNTAAGYTVNEVLRGENVRVVGRTSSVAGEATVAGGSLTAATFTVTVGDITTDSSQRDAQFRSPMILDTTAHPTATFAVASPVDVSGLPTDGTSGTVTVTGDLTVKGTTKRVTVPLKVLRTGTEVVVEATVPVRWTDYGVTAPSLGFVTVEDTGEINLLAVLQRR